MAGNALFFILFNLAFVAPTFGQISTGRTIYFYRTMNIPKIIVEGLDLAKGDRINRGAGKLDHMIISGNLEVEKTPEYAMAKCGLEGLGFELPKSTNGLYFGAWPNRDDYGFTHTTEFVTLHGMERRSYSLLHYQFMGINQRSRTIGDFLKFLITVYHEVKGHNLDNAFHDSEADLEAFAQTYEVPIYKAARKGFSGLYEHCLKEVGKQQPNP